MSDESFFSGPPQTMFVFGLVAGIACAAILGLLFFSAPAVPSDRFVATDTVPEVVDPTPSAPVVATLPEVTEDDWIDGDLSKAKVVMVEYSDFECPFCGRHYPNMKKIGETYGDDVAIVFRHFPLSFHPEAVPSALASECVGAQGGDEAFFEFKDAMFTYQDSLGTELYEATVQDLGLNLVTYRDCVENNTYTSEISKDQAGGSAAGVSGTPATFINGQLVSGAVPYEQLSAIVEAAL